MLEKVDAAFDFFPQVRLKGLKGGMVTGCCIEHELHIYCAGDKNSRADFLRFVGAQSRSGPHEVLMRLMFVSGMVSWW